MKLSKINDFTNVKLSKIDDSTNVNISKICDALGNETRYEIVRSLKNKTIATCCNKIEYYENGMSVGDVVKSTGLAQSTVSQHIKVLLDAKIIHREKRGSWTVFFLDMEVITAFLSSIKSELEKNDCECDTNK